MKFTSAFAVLFFLAGLTAQAQQNLSIMTYNVENLFDSTHDVGKDDWEYLSKQEKETNPLARAWCQTNGQNPQRCLNLNWDESSVKEKLIRIADVIAQKGTGPDIVIIPETENINILTRLVKETRLSAMGYQTIALVEGPDKRGIDVGVISKLPLAASAKLHLIDFKTTNPPAEKPILTRGIIEVPLKLRNGKVLHVFGGHFPSQSHPTSQRRDALNMMTSLMNERLAAGQLTLAGGDLNIIATEEQTNGLFADANTDFLVSHFDACRNCQGTHFFKGEWGFLDILLFPKSLDNSGRLILNRDSVTVAKASKYQLDQNGAPARFDVNRPIGVADHLPLYAEFSVEK